MTLEGTVMNGVIVIDGGAKLPEGERVRIEVTEPKELSASAGTPQERGWRPGYFESTFGSITDETFVRAPQGDPHDDSTWTDEVRDQLRSEACEMLDSFGKDK